LLYKNIKITGIPAVLYKFETYYLMLREGYRLRVFKNRVLKRIFEPKRTEVTGGWRTLHNEELHSLFSTNIIGMIKSRRMRWVGHIVYMGEIRYAHNILVGRPEGMRPLGRPRLRWKDNIKVDLWEIWFGGVDWICLAEQKDQWWACVNTVMKPLLPGFYSPIQAKTALTMPLHRILPNAISFQFLTPSVNPLACWVV
jgi:hypothetical protein